MNFQFSCILQIVNIYNLKIYLWFIWIKLCIPPPCFNIYFFVIFFFAVLFNPLVCFRFNFNILTFKFTFNFHPRKYAENVVNSTKKYISAVIFDRREDVSSMTYPFQSITKWRKLIVLHLHLKQTKIIKNLCKTIYCLK